MFVIHVCPGYVQKLSQLSQSPISSLPLCVLTIILNQFDVQVELFGLKP